MNFERQELEGAESASKGSAHRHGTSGQEVTVTATQHQHAEMMVQPEGATSTLMTQLTEYATTGWVDSQLSLTTRKTPDDGTFSLKGVHGSKRQKSYREIVGHRRPMQELSMALDLQDNLSSSFLGVVNDKPKWASNPSAFWRCFHPMEK